MYHIQTGTDTYGRVKAVAGTAIVTKFFMFQSLPVFPLRSYYFIRHGETTRSGVPFFASEETTSIVGLPLASIDVASALMAYVRAGFATMTVVGSIAMVPGIIYLTGEHLDDFAMTATKGLLASLTTGIVGGLLTYAIPLISHRERDIRAYCAELLGVSADPARVTPEAQKMIGDYIDDPQLMTDHPRTRQIRQLIATRLELANSENARAFEDRTDNLLERLRADEQAGGRAEA